MQICKAVKCGFFPLQRPVKHCFIPSVSIVKASGPREKVVPEFREKIKLRITRNTRNPDAIRGHTLITIA